MVHPMHWMHGKIGFVSPPWDNNRGEGDSSLERIPPFDIGKDSDDLREEIWRYLSTGGRSHATSMLAKFDEINEEKRPLLKAAIGSLISVLLIDDQNLIDTESK